MKEMKKVELLEGNENFIESVKKKLEDSGLKVKLDFVKLIPHYECYDKDSDVLKGILRMSYPSHIIIDETKFNLYGDPSQKISQAIELMNV